MSYRSLYKIMDQVLYIWERLGRAIGRKLPGERGVL